MTWPGAGSDMQKVTPGCEGQGCGAVVQPGGGGGGGGGCPCSGGMSTRPTSKLSGVCQQPGRESGWCSSRYGRVLFRFRTQEPAVWQGCGSLWQGSGRTPDELLMSPLIR